MTPCLRHVPQAHHIRPPGIALPWWFSEGFHHPGLFQCRQIGRSQHSADVPFEDLMEHRQKPVSDPVAQREVRGITLVFPIENAFSGRVADDFLLRNVQKRTDQS